MKRPGLVNLEWVWGALIRKLKLSPTPTVLAEFDGKLGLTLDLDSILWVAKVASKTTTFNANAWGTVFTVDKGKRIRLIGVDVSQSSGTFDFAHLAVLDENGNVRHIIERTSVDALPNTFVLARVPLGPAWTLQMLASSLTVAGDLVVTTYYEEQDDF